MTAKKGALFAVMCLLGLGALIVPAWLYDANANHPIRPMARTLAGTGGAGAQGLGLLALGLCDSLTAAKTGLEQGHRSDAVYALDAADRAAKVGKAAAEPESPFASAEEKIRAAKMRLQDGDPAGAERALSDALGTLSSPAIAPSARSASTQDYEGAMVVNAHGVRIGELEAVQGGRVKLALGGARDLWGFIDLGTARELELPADALIYGPRKSAGYTIVALPSLELSR